MCEFVTYTSIHESKGDYKVNTYGIVEEICKYSTLIKQQKHLFRLHLDIDGKNLQLNVPYSFDKGLSIGKDDLIILYNVRAKNMVKNIGLYCEDDSTIIVYKKKDRNYIKYGYKDLSDIQNYQINAFIFDTESRYPSDGKNLPSIIIMSNILNSVNSVNRSSKGTVNSTNRSSQGSINGTNSSSQSSINRSSSTNNSSQGVVKSSYSSSQGSVKSSYSSSQGSVNNSYSSSQGSVNNSYSSSQGSVNSYTSSQGSVSYTSSQGSVNTSYTSSQGSNQEISNQNLPVQLLCNIEREHIESHPYREKKMLVVEVVELVENTQRGNGYSVIQLTDYTLPNHTLSNYNYVFQCSVFNPHDQMLRSKGVRNGTYLSIIGLNVKYYKSYIQSYMGKDKQYDVKVLDEGHVHVQKLLDRKRELIIQYPQLAGNITLDSLRRIKIPNSESFSSQNSSNSSTQQANSSSTQQASIPSRIKVDILGNISKDNLNTGDYRANVIVEITEIIESKTFTMRISDYSFPILPGNRKKRQEITCIAFPPCGQYLKKLNAEKGEYLFLSNLTVKHYDGFVDSTLGRLKDGTIPRIIKLDPNDPQLKELKLRKKDVEENRTAEQVTIAKRSREYCSAEDPILQKYLRNSDILTDKQVKRFHNRYNIGQLW